MSNLTKTNNTMNGVASIFDELFNNESFKVAKSKIGNKSTPVNIKETEDDFTLDFSIPGIKKEDVKIELDNEKLTVSADFDSSLDNDGNFTRREFHLSNFKRSFILPDTINASKIKASHENGILAVTIPKKEEAKPKPVRTISIGK